MTHAGKRLDASSDFVCRGGASIISRGLFWAPTSCSNSSSAPQITEWCGAVSKSGLVYSVKLRRLSLAFSLRRSSELISDREKLFGGVFVKAAVVIYVEIEVLRYE